MKANPSGWLALRSKSSLDRVKALDRDSFVKRCPTIKGCYRQTGGIKLTRHPASSGEAWVEDGKSLRGDGL